MDQANPTSTEGPVKRRGRPPKSKAKGRKPKASSAVASRPIGRPSEYTDEIGERICDLLADGLGLFAICKLPGMPHERTVRRWAQNPDHTFSERYSAAREVGYLRMADRMIDLADDISIEVNNRRLMVDTRKFVLMKCLPKIYGDRIVQNNSISMQSIHLHTEPHDSTDEWLRTVVSKIAAVPPPRQIEATATPAEDPLAP